MFRSIFISCFVARVIFGVMGLVRVELGRGCFLGLFCFIDMEVTFLVFTCYIFLLWYMCFIRLFFEVVDFWVFSLVLLMFVYREFTVWIFFFEFVRWVRLEFFSFSIIFVRFFFRVDEFFFFIDVVFFRVCSYEGFKCVLECIEWIFIICFCYFWVNIFNYICCFFFYFSIWFVFIFK